MNKIALPSNMGISYIGWCDVCEINDADLCSGYGINFEEICYKCRIRGAHEFDYSNTEYGT